MLVRNVSFMEETYYCYICGNPIKGKEVSVEHIILNGIGGKLRSKKLLCKTCNGNLGSGPDVALSESLSFYTDMLQVKKDRDNHHKQLMMDEDGHEVIVEKGGTKLELRRSYYDKQEVGNEKRYNITAKSEEDLQKYLAGQVKAGELTQAQMDEIMAKAKMTSHRPKLSTRTVIPKEAFPSIVKSAVNYYVACTRRIEDVKHLIPYIKGEKNCKDILNIVLFDKLPYEEKPEEITHMIHLEGNPKTGVLYALMEYYGVYTYVVFLKENYDGPELNVTYCYDVLHEKLVARDFSLPVDRNWIEDFKKDFSQTCKKRFAAVEGRANKIMGAWQDKDKQRIVKEIVEKAFKKYPEGCMITPEIAHEIEKDIAEGLAKYIVE